MRYKRVSNSNGALSRGLNISWAFSIPRWASVSALSLRRGICQGRGATRKFTSSKCELHYSITAPSSRRCLWWKMVESCFNTMPPGLMSSSQCVCVCVCVPTFCHREKTKAASVQISRSPEVRRTRHASAGSSTQGTAWGPSNIPKRPGNSSFAGPWKSNAGLALNIVFVLFFVLFSVLFCLLSCTSLPNEKQNTAEIPQNSV